MLKCQYCMMSSLERTEANRNVMLFLIYSANASSAQGSKGGGQGSKTEFPLYVTNVPLDLNEVSFPEIVTGQISGKMMKIF